MESERTRSINRMILLSQRLNMIVTGMQIRKAQLLTRLEPKPKSA